MAQAKVMNGEKLLIKIGDGQTPENFNHPCLINTERGIQFSASTNDSIQPDCDDPSLPAWLVRNKDGLSATINGAGTLHTPSIEEFFDWFRKDETKKIRVQANVPGADGGGYWAGDFHLTEFQISGTRKESATATLTLVSSGWVTWTDAA